MDFSKITKNFTYLTIPDIVSPPQDPRRICFSSKAAKQCTADRLKARLFKLAKDKQQKKDRKAFKTFLMDSGATSHYTRPSDGLPIIGASRKRVMVANGATIVYNSANDKYEVRPLDIEEFGAIDGGTF